MLLALYLLAILYPNCSIKLGANSQQSSAKLFREKHNDLVNKMYPALANEIKEFRIAKDDVEIKFKNGSIVTNVGLNQNAKGGNSATYIKKLV